MISMAILLFFGVLAAASGDVQVALFCFTVLALDLLIDYLRKHS